MHAHIAAADSADLPDMELDVEPLRSHGYEGIEGSVMHDIDADARPTKKARWERPRQLGPATATDAVHWSRSCLKQLFSVPVDSGTNVSSTSWTWGDRLQELWSKGLCLRTDYSGLGGGEEAVKHIDAALAEASAPGVAGLEGHIVCQHASDSSKQCRSVLAAHTGPTKPQCLFGDIMERCPEALKAALQKLHHKHLTVAAGKPDKNEHGRARPRQVMKEEAEKFFQAAVTLVKRDVEKNHHAKQKEKKKKELTAYCYIHKCQCEVLPPPPASLPDCTVVAMAGVNCYDWSTMGAQRGWLGQSSLVFLEWARERLLATDEHLCIIECVSQFPDHQLEQLFTPDRYSIHVLHFSPTCIGLPTERRRKYMVVISREHAALNSEVCEMGVQHALEMAFGREVAMNGDALLRAPAAVLADYTKELARARNLPSTRCAKTGHYGIRVLQTCFKS